MKKILTITISSMVGIGLMIGGIFWWKVLLDPQSPEFVAVQGIVAQGPTIERSDDTYTITWSTTDNYPNNEVVMKSSASKYPDAGVGADTNYDADNNVYVHTARFRLSDSREPSKDIPVFATGDYTYQVKSTGLNDKDPTIGSVLDLDQSQ